MADSVRQLREFHLVPEPSVNRNRVTERIVVSETESRGNLSNNLVDHRLTRLLEFTRAISGKLVPVSRL